ncbi:MAG: hypothetical protein K6G90_11045 [Clostridia bacterium]|nr:hypothetical protein [Clostridia bacterium]
MIFQQNNDHSNENARQQEIPAAETGNDARKEEQPLWMRTLIINGCRFISREELDLKTVKNEGTFILQGKQMNFRELPLSFEKEIDDSISFFRDTEDGERVLAVYEDVPIFDSGDAMYDSIHKAYIKRTGNELNALYISNGYYLSKAYIYRDLQPENEKAVKLLRDAGFLND